MVFTQTLSPVLLKLAGIEIRWYGLVYAVFFLIAYFWVSKNANKFNLTKQHTEDFMFYLILSSILGARLFYFLTNTPLTLLTNPFELFKIWQGGMSIHGGIFGALLAAYFFAKKHKINFFDLSEPYFLILPLAQVFGRIANFLNQEVIGFPTNLPWAVIFPLIDNKARHPTQLYEAILDLFVFIILIIIYKTSEKQSFSWHRKSFGFSSDQTKNYQPQTRPKGMLFYSYFLLYLTARFIADFTRDQSRLLIFTQAQWFSLLFVPISLYALIKTINKYKQKHTTSQQT